MINIEEELADGFPTLNRFKEILFDANSNIELSENDRKIMQRRLEKKFVEVMEILRISRNDPNSQDTARRISKMFVNELMWGRFNAPPQITVFPNRKKVDELIILL